MASPGEYRTCRAVRTALDARRRVTTFPPLPHHTEQTEGSHDDRFTIEGHRRFEDGETRRSDHPVAPPAGRRRLRRTSTVSHAGARPDRPLPAPGRDGAGGIRAR